jgi:outer membrane protein
MTMIPLQKQMSIAIILIVGLSSGFAFAQNNRALSLSEAVDLCLQNNKQLKVNTLKVKSANATITEAKDRRLPDASVAASYLRLTKPDISGPLGASASNTTINQASYVMANASLPLFAGFKVKNGIESAKFLEKATQLDAESEKDALVQNAVAAYSNLYKAKVAVELVKLNLKSAEQRSSEFTHLEAKGIIAKNDLLKVQLQQSNIQLALMDAESNWRMANLNMDLMLGLTEDTQLILDSAAFVDINNTKTYSEWQQAALSGRHDIEALTYREKSAISGIKIAKGDYFPALKLSGGYFAANIPGLMTISNAWNGGVGVSYSISSIWKTGSKVSSARIQLAQVKANQEILADHVKLDIAQAYETYILSKQKIEVYAKAVDQTAENNKITKSKYRNNLVTTTDLLDADLQQLQAQINYANAKADVVVAYHKLLQASGSGFDK